MRRINVTEIVIFFFLNLPTLHIYVNGNLRWLSYGAYPSNEIWEKTSVCSKKYGLTGKQIRFCKKNFHWISFAEEAAVNTREECQHQLKTQQWNCMSLNRAPVYDTDLKKATRQAAFVYALSAASLAISISRGCMTGQISECSCYAKHQVSFPSEIIDAKNLSNIDEMLPCKDVTKAGKKFTRSFTTLGFRSKYKTEQQENEIAIKKHNIHVGLRALGEKEEISCVCNGATAGCVVKFCHRHIVRFEDVAKKLVKMYRTAAYLPQEELTKKKKITGNRGDKQEKMITLSHDYENKLIYSNKRENICQQSTIVKRQCVLDETKPNSCKNLCCGKGYQEKMIEISGQCRCKFVYCCRVVCDTCRSMKKIVECL